MAETETTDNGADEELASSINLLPSQTTAESDDGVMSVDEEPAAAELASSIDLLPSQTTTESDDGVMSVDEEPAAEELASSSSIDLPSQTAVESDGVLSVDEEPAAEELASSIDLLPSQTAVESDGVVSVDEEPAATNSEEREHGAGAEVFAGFSLQSSGIRFRGPRSGKTVRVFQDRSNTQLVLEDIRDAEDGNFGMELKGVVDVSHALSLLRATYSMIAVFMGGFLFILGFDILLFLFIHLTTVFNKNQSTGVTDFVATLFSIPVYVYSLAFAMTLVTQFVIDTFYGHPLLHSFGLGVVFTEWMAFIFYLGVPTMAFIFTLFTGKSNWWELSLLTWFSSVLIFWCIFSACVFYFEVTQCLKLQRDMHGDNGVTAQMRFREKTLYWLSIAKEATKNTMKIRLSGTEAKYKKQKGEEKPEYEDRHNCCPVGPLSLITRKLPNCVYKQFDEEGQQKVFPTLGEVLGLTSYVTRYSWSLEKLFCRTGGQTSNIFLTSGESRVKERQIQSSIACRIIGDLLICLLVIGLLVWLNGSGVEENSARSSTSTTTGLLLIGLLFLVIVAYIAYNTKYLIAIGRDIADQSGVTWTRFWEVRLINEPKDGFIWFCFDAEIVLFYLFPLISLCIQQNSPSACLFAFFGFFSFSRHYLNGAILLRAYEHDFFEVIPYAADDASEEERRRRRRRWKQKSRAFNLLNVGIDTARTFWTGVFSVLVFFFFVIVLLYARNDSGGSNTGYKSNTTTPVEGYVYRRNSNLPYPTCVLRVSDKDLVDGDLVDYAFLANLAYTIPTEEQQSLKSWFGKGVVRMNDTLVQEFKKDFPFEEYGISRNSPVVYKLVQSEVDPTYVMITIRGTATVLDVMADAQLWISAFLFQGVRELLPLGNIFTPILHHLVRVVNSLETDAITEVAYYQETREFAKFLMDKGYRVKVTGHSLGGGLALITGAQAKVSAVGISAPNAKLSRDTFYGRYEKLLPVTLHDLNTYTFNVVPDNDPVPMIDDKADLYQHINCTASANDIAGCHDVVRSICEIQFKCGSKSSYLNDTYRPVLCECVLKYGYSEPYPMPGTDTSSSFADKCIAKYPCKWGNATQKENEGCPKKTKQYDSSK